MNQFLERTHYRLSNAHLGHMDTYYVGADVEQYPGFNPTSQMDKIVSGTISRFWADFPKWFVASCEGGRAFRYHPSSLIFEDISSLLLFEKDFIALPIGSLLQSQRVQFTILRGELHLELSYADFKGLYESSYSCFGTSGYALSQLLSEDTLLFGSRSVYLCKPARGGFALLVCKIRLHTPYRVTSLFVFRAGPSLMLFCPSGTAGMGTARFRDKRFRRFQARQWVPREEADFHPYGLGFHVVARYTTHCLVDPFFRGFIHAQWIFTKRKDYDYTLPSEESTS